MTTIETPTLTDADPQLIDAGPRTADVSADEPDGVHPMGTEPFGPGSAGLPAGPGVSR